MEEKVLKNASFWAINSKKIFKEGVGGNDRNAQYISLFFSSKKCNVLRTLEMGRMPRSENLACTLGWKSVFNWYKTVLQFVFWFPWFANLECCRVVIIVSCVHRNHKNKQVFPHTYALLLGRDQGRNDLPDWGAFRHRSHRCRSRRPGTPVWSNILSYTFHDNNR